MDDILKNLPLELRQMVEDHRINLMDAYQKVLPVWRATGRSIEDIVGNMGLEVGTDTSEVQGICQTIKDSYKFVGDIGDLNKLNILTGEVMKACKGKFPPALVKQILAKLLTENKEQNDYDFR